MAASFGGECLDLSYDATGEALAVANSCTTLPVIYSRADGVSWSPDKDQPISPDPATSGFDQRQHPQSISWAPVEHGRGLAAGYADGTVVIWEPTSSFDNQDKCYYTHPLYPCLCAKDATGQVGVVRFAPVAAGRLLATGADDGVVRVYVSDGSGAPWKLRDEFSVRRDAEEKTTITTLAWAPTTAEDAPLLAVATGCAAAAGATAAPSRAGGISLWSRHSAHRATGRVGVSDAGGAWFLALDLLGSDSPTRTLAWGPRAGRNAHTLASAGGDGAADHRVALWRIVSDGAPPPEMQGSEEDRAAASRLLLVSRATGSSVSGSPLAFFIASHGVPIDQVEFTPSGALVTSAGPKFLTWRETTHVGGWVATGEENAE